MARREKPITDGGAEDPRLPLPSFELDQHLFFWLTQVLDRRDRNLTRELKPFGLRVPNWRVLASLYSRHGLSMSELAALTSVDRTTLSRTIERMVRKGWILRMSDSSDMRVTRLALTAAGQRLFASIWPAVQRLNRSAVAEMPEPMVGLLCWGLQQMSHSLDVVLSRPADEPSLRGTRGRGASPA